MKIGSNARSRISHGSQRFTLLARYSLSSWRSWSRKNVVETWQRCAHEWMESKVSSLDKIKRSGSWVGSVRDA